MPFVYGPWHGQHRRVARRPRVLVPVPTRSVPIAATSHQPPDAPALDFVTYELREDERGQWHEEVDEGDDRPSTDVEG